MNEKQIECFLTVSKYQSFSRAAQALFMTQPTVTHQIAALEEELGFSLFVRSYRAISLTPAGQRFEERMRPAVEQLQSIVSECKQIARNEDGCLTLGHYFPEGDWMFYHAIYAFSSLYPAFHIDTHLPPSTELVDRLLTRQLDAIVAPHQLITVQDELKQTTLFSACLITTIPSKSKPGMRRRSAPSARNSAAATAEPCAQSSPTCAPSPA